jgi:hypothetical protein
MSRAAGLDDAKTLAEWILQLPLADGIKVPPNQQQNQCSNHRGQTIRNSANPGTANAGFEF